MSDVQHLLVDARPVDHPTARQRGIGRYVHGLLEGLVRIGAPHTALYGSDAEYAVLSESIPGLNLVRLSPEVFRRHMGPDEWYLATLLMQTPVPWDPIPSIITRSRIPVAAVMYDVIPYRYPERYLRFLPGRREAELCGALAKTVDAMAAISTFSADTAAEVFDFPRDRIAVVGAGVGPEFVARTVRDHGRPERVLPATVERYVIAVTGGDERKNTHGLLHAWSLLPERIRTRYHLVVACAVSRHQLTDWRTQADELGLGDQVIFTGAVSDTEMVALHQYASLSVMPSIDEGFGLPVIEAAASGIPAICSGVSSLPEVLDEPAACFDPHDPISIAERITIALEDDTVRATLLAAGERATRRWRWERVAADTIAALGAIGPRWHQPRRRLHHRLALAGPMEGSASGIGVYDIALVDALHRRIAERRDTSLSVFVESSGSTEPTRGDLGRFPIRALGHAYKQWDYDDIVFVLGSSHFHVAAAELARRLDGHLWLHEPSLVGVHLGIADGAATRDWAERYLRERFAHAGTAERAAATGLDLRNYDQLDAAGITLLDETIATARSVIVSTTIAADTVRRLRPDGPPLLVMPLAHRAPGPRRQIPSAHELIAVGWLAPNKDPFLALEVLAAAAASDPEISLTFVGQPLGDIATEVIDTARRLGIGDRVHIAGRLDDADYHQRLAKARVALQLRRGERGEMSAPITELLAAGTPVVSNMVSALPASPGVRVVEAGDDRNEHVRLLAAAVTALMLDDELWAGASYDARTRAGSWGFDQVADRLLDWVREVPHLAPGSIAYAGPAALGIARRTTVLPGPR